MNSFDTNPFAFHTLPLAAYIEPAGYEALTCYKSVRMSHYERLVPLTLDCARGLSAGLVEDEKWARQFRRRDGGQWSQEVRWERYPARGDKDRPGKRIELQDILRTLTRPNVYAVARTDEHVKEREKDHFDPRAFRTLSVRTLCLDVDMPAVWKSNDIHAFKQELALEQQLAHALGLPYSVFRTGGKGHQIVIPLPHAIDRSAASWILAAYASLLEPIQARWGHAIRDADNLRGLVRLAGGRHISTGRLALWIDPRTGNLHPLDKQIELMRTGYTDAEGATLSPTAFAEATGEIAAFLARQYRPRHLPLHRASAEIAVWAAVAALPDNALVAMFERAYQDWGECDRAIETTRFTAQKSVAAREVPSDWHRSGGLQRWAENIWDMPLDAGCFWSWISEGGHRGITAAKVLFGENRALPRLLEKIESAPDLPATTMRERLYKARKLYEDHALHVNTSPQIVAASGVLDAEAEQLIPQIISALHARKSIQVRNRAEIEHLVFALLYAFQRAEQGYIEVSLDRLCDAINARWPDSFLSRSTASRHLRRLKLGEDACGFSLIEEIKMDRFGWNPGSRFRPGPDLRATDWGRKLPVDECIDARDRAHIKLRQRVVVGGCLITRVIEYQQPQRGRRPKARQAQIQP